MRRWEERLEATSDPTPQLHVEEFDLQNERFSGRYWQYQVDAPDDTITELSPLAGDSRHRLLAIESSDEATGSAQSAKVYSVDLDSTDTSGFLIKRQVLGLPYAHIESLIPVDDQRLLVFNDNDYPYTTNDTQGIIVRPDEPLPK